MVKQLNMSKRSYEFPSTKISSNANEISNEDNLKLTESRNKMESNVKCVVVAGDPCHELTNTIAYGAISYSMSTTVVAVLMGAEKSRNLGESREISSKEALNLRAKMLGSSITNKEKSLEISK